MARLTWDQTGDRYYETGVSKGVLYPWSAAEGEPGDPDYLPAGYNYGYAWNGLTSISESPDGADENALYADNIKYLSLRSAEDLNLTINAYTYPDAWMQCDGTAELGGIPGVYVAQQKRKLFGLCYSTVVGNDTEGNDAGEKLHLIYGATAAPSDREFQTINDSPDAIEFSWECNTTPIDMPGDLKKSALITIDSTKFGNTAIKRAGGKYNLDLLKDKLYGTESTGAYLPTPTEVLETMSVTYSVLSTEPEDWATKYNKYLRYDAATETLTPNSSATFVANAFAKPSNYVAG